MHKRNPKQNYPYVDDFLKRWLAIRLNFCTRSRWPFNWRLPLSGKREKQKTISIRRDRYEWLRNSDYLHCVVLGDARRIWARKVSSSLVLCLSNSGVWAIDYEGLGSVGASPINSLITYLGYQNYFPKIFLDPKLYFRVLIKNLQDINLNIHWN